ncbi:hypothetical protein ACFQU3_19370 [Terrabacter sp. GCM10028922]|uniref:hypothetical protein n=1 Tax=Terrabacter sp. GCM10028922 TaxID=3273428 RepID=UPI003609298D
MNEDVSRIVIGMDPHKRTVTIEVMTADETVLDGGRFSAAHERIHFAGSVTAEGCSRTARRL